MFVYQFFPYKISFLLIYLTHWGRVMHICVGNLTITGSDNGLSPGRCQAITWTNVGILLIGPLGTNFSEMLIEIIIFSFKKMSLKVSSAKWRPFCLGLNVLRTCHHYLRCSTYHTAYTWALLLWVFFAVWISVLGVYFNIRSSTR